MRIRPHSVAACTFFLCASLLTGCSQPSAHGIADLAGHWAGERDEDGAVTRWLVHSRGDGTLAIEFQTCFAGQRVATTEHYGRATLEDGLYRTVIVTVVRDGETFDLGDEEALRYDYDVLQLSDDRMVYRFVGRPPLVYTVRRVAEDHVLTCPPATHSVNSSARGRRGADGWIRRGRAAAPAGNTGATMDGATPDGAADWRAETATNPDADPAPDRAPDAVPAANPDTNRNLNPAPVTEMR